jgi:hypothetical protein
MLAPRKPVESAKKAHGNENGVSKRWKWLPFFEPFGFSLRLNLWYAAFFVLGAFLLFGLAYVLLARQTSQRDRDVVRAQLDACRAWYIQGGAAALQLHFKDQTEWEKATTFLEVRSTTQQLLFFHPANAKDQEILKQVPENQTANNSTDWISLPSGEQNMVWTIASTELPDGCLMHVGRTTDDTLHRFRTIFLFAITPMVAFGFCCGAFITYRALHPIREILERPRA